ncbi:MAG: hypothetical protein GX491_01855 [Chloroflexi bacterium]|nr:hypothetical protein [Chloroflexota bacterium]
MAFNKRSRLDPSQVQDRRGRTGKAVAAGGGGLGLLVLLIYVLLGGDPGDLGTVMEQQPQAPAAGGEDITNLEEVCQTGEDANTRDDCRIVGFVNSIQAFWTEEFSRMGGDYTPADTVLFTGATTSGCGNATAAVGPFYCPRDQMVYLDLDFFDELQTRFGAKGGPFAEGYVLAHEYGHHIQNLAGVLDNPSRATGPESEAVMIELQADCLAGVWAHNATETGYLTRVTDEEIAQSLDAAAAVGDDRIQRQTQGYVSPESWTHGSSEQRQQALLDGFRTGTMDTCTTPGW